MKNLTLKKVAGYFILLVLFILTIASIIYALGSFWLAIGLISGCAIIAALVNWAMNLIYSD